MSLASSNEITFSLTGNTSTTGSYGNVRTFTQNGVSVDVSAFSSNKYNGNWKTAYLGAYGGGLGVTNRHESGHEHRVDNRHENDYILFEFDQDVTVDRAFLDSVYQDSDISVWIGDRNGDISLLDSSILSGFTKENNNGGSHARWADFNAAELTGNTLVISARDDHNYDAFKLKELDISVPVNDPIEAVTYEAEDMQLHNYNVEHVGNVASGGEVIKLTGHEGSAKVNFNGASGDYDIVVGYFDENDGKSRAKVKIDGHVEANWKWNQHLNSAWVSENNFVQYAIDNVHLENGSEIKLSADRDRHEFGRFDYVKIVDKNTITAAEEGVQDELLIFTEAEPKNPGIDIETLTNGVDADTIADAPEIAAGDTVTWTYEVTNTGDVAFAKNEITVTDDQQGTITNIIDKGNGDNILGAGETWIYQKTGTAQNVSDNYVNIGSVSAGGVSDSDQSGYINPEVDSITYEAEDMQLHNYKVQHVGNVASGGEVIKVTGHEGSAKVKFDGVTGDYDIVVGYFDENDGKSHARVKVDGHVEASWTWDQHLDSAFVSEKNFVQYAIDDVHIEHGSEISLWATKNHYEFGRFDYVSIVDKNTITAAQEGVQDELLLV